MNLSLYVKGLILVCAGLALTACDDKKPKDTLQEQAKEQGYPVLIANPQVADYGLPFCEKKYCIDIEIQSFKSDDAWFNQFTDSKIADLIRQQIGIKEKMSVQQAVDGFIQKSDAWQEEHPSQPWSMQIEPRVPTQQNEIAVLQIATAFLLGDKTIPQRNYFYIVDRKAKKQIVLFDVIDANHRLAFGDFIQQQYQNWKKALSPEQQAKTPPKVGWASQDWVIDEQGVIVYYRASDLGVPEAKNLVVQIPKANVQQWFSPAMLKQLQLK